MAGEEGKGEENEKVEVEGKVTGLEAVQGRRRGDG